jgi:hypothetical protein
MTAPHAITVGPAAAKLVDANGRASELPKPRHGGHRARCTCGWRGAERATAEQAQVDGRAHVRLTMRPHDLDLPTLVGEPEPLL